MSAPAAPLIPLRIRLPYTAEPEFVARYGSNVSRGGIFIATRALKPEGTPLAFELLLKTGQVLLRGEAVVVKTQVDSGGGRSGMTLRFVRLDPPSRAVVERVVAQRARPRPRLPAAPDRAAAEVERSRLAALSRRIDAVLAAEEAEEPPGASPEQAPEEGEAGESAPGAERATPSTAATPSWVARPVEETSVHPDGPPLAATNATSASSTPNGLNFGAAEDSSAAGLVAESSVHADEPPLAAADDASASDAPSVLDFGAAEDPSKIDLATESTVHADESALAAADNVSAFDAPSVLDFGTAEDSSAADPVAESNAHVDEPPLATSEDASASDVPSVLDFGTAEDSSTAGPFAESNAHVDEPPLATSEDASASDAPSVLDFGATEDSSAAAFIAESNANADEPTLSTSDDASTSDAPSVLNFGAAEDSSAAAFIAESNANADESPLATSDDASAADAPSGLDFGTAEDSTTAGLVADSNAHADEPPPAASDNASVSDASSVLEFSVADDSSTADVVVESSVHAGEPAEDASVSDALSVLELSVAEDSSTADFVAESSVHAGEPALVATDDAISDTPSRLDFGAAENASMANLVADADEPPLSATGDAASADTQSVLDSSAAAFVATSSAHADKPPLATTDEVATLSDASSGVDFGLDAEPSASVLAAKTSAQVDPPPLTASDDAVPAAEVLGVEIAPVSEALSALHLDVAKRASVGSPIAETKAPAEKSPPTGAEKPAPTPDLPEGSHLGAVETPSAIDLAAEDSAVHTQTTNAAPIEEGPDDSLIVLTASEAVPDARTVARDGEEPPAAMGLAPAPLAPHALGGESSPVQRASTSTTGVAEPLGPPTLPEAAAAQSGEVLGIELAGARARAAVWSDGVTAQLPLASGMDFPLLVAFDSGRWYFGREAAAHGGAVPLFSPPKDPLRPTHPAHSDRHFQVNGGNAPARLVGAHLLARLHAELEGALGRPVRDVLFVVPSWFSYLDRALLAEAAGLAGFRTLQLLHATSAACASFAQGLGLARKRILALHAELAHFEAAVVQVTGDDLEIISTQGALPLGEAVGLDQMAEVTRAVLAASGASAGSLDAVIRFGDPAALTRAAPPLSELLQRPLPDPLDDAAAVRGAALLGHAQAELARGKRGGSAFEVLVSPISLVQRDGTLRRVLEAGTRIPAEKALTVPLAPSELLALIFCDGPAARLDEADVIGAANVESGPMGGELSVRVTVDRNGQLGLSTSISGGRVEQRPLTRDFDPGAMLPLTLPAQPARKSGFLRGIVQKLGKG